MDTEQEPKVEQEETNEVNSPKQISSAKSAPMGPMAMLGTVLLLIVVGGGIYYYMQNYGPASSNVPSVDVPSGDNTDATLTTDEGVTWLGAPQKLGDLKLIVNNPDGDVTYYKLGTDNGSDIIYALAYYGDGPGSGSQLFFVKTGTNTYDYLVNPSKAHLGPDAIPVDPDKLASNVKENDTKVYHSIDNPDVLTVQGNKIQLFGQGFQGGSSFFADMVTSNAPVPASQKLKATEFATTPYGTLYNLIIPAQQYSYPNNDYEHPVITVANIVAGTRFILKQPDGIGQIYQYPLAFVKDDLVPQITWTNGTKNTAAYRFDGFTQGCGAGGASLNILVSGSMDGLAQTGTTTTGGAIYEPTSTSHPLVKAGYALLQNGQYYDSQSGEQKTITIDQYLTKHPLLVYKDPFGRLLVFTSQTYGLQAECGKPVVYLYPTQTEKVSVAVGAAITKSEPAYNKGWTVTAQPNGTLTTTDGKQYDSLFWEGLGKGTYPTITQGFVVKQSELRPTLVSQLSALGLNAKESADFMAFWEPKMPTTPYVRLTWFGTSQMNELAPLTITPKPDTLIRIFLDFEGLNSKISLPVERLSSLPRQGFTVVEWGGLLVH